MTKFQPSSTARLFRFRTASAGPERSNLLEKLMMSRPKVASAPLVVSRSIEEQDDVLSGMTRSLQRRLSGLNIPMAIRRATVQRRVA